MKPPSWCQPNFMPRSAALTTYCSLNRYTVSPSAALAICAIRSERRNLRNRVALAVGMEEVAAATVVEVKLVDAEAIHLPVALVDEALAVAAEGVEVARSHDALEDEESFVTKASSVVGRDDGI